MDINPTQGQQAEIYKLVRENNKMLHAMRRNAMWGGVLKFVIYALFLLGPLWFYMTYINGPVQQVLNTVNKVQATGAEAQAQVTGLQDQLMQVVHSLGSLMRSPTSSAATSSATSTPKQ